MNEEHKYLLFLGCAIPYRLLSYEISARKVLAKLGVELVEMPECNCCGLPLDPVNHKMMLLMATRNLVIAEQRDLDILALCPGCSGTLQKVNKNLKLDPKLRKKVNLNLDKTGFEFKGTIEVKHLIQALVEDVGLERIESSLKVPLTALKVAEHNGCHILRPRAHAKFDDPENPQKLKSLIEVTGAKTIDYIDKTECCGAPSVGIDDKIPLMLTKDKLDHIRAARAQAMITVCPFCHMMYDMNQKRVEKLFYEEYNLPILHYPQLLGLAMGLKPEELAFKDLRTNAEKIVQRISK